MDLNDAEDLATDLMDEHGLIEQGWRFEWSNRKAALGDCNYVDQVIRLSKPLTLVNDEAQMLDTILHEIAHVLAGRAAGHGPKWRAAARKLGARPVAAAANSVGVPPAWRLTCPSGCGFEIKRHKKTKLQGSCPKCSHRGKYDAKFHLVWVRAEGMIAA